MSSPDVDVVIVTWEGRELLASCLDHLRAQTAPHTPIVVDNGSSDGTVDMVRASYPEAVVVDLPENVGFGRANDIGVARGSAPYVVLLNNDVDAAPELVERAVQPLRDDDGVGAVAALTTRPGDGLVDQFGVQLDPGLGAYARGVGQDPDHLDVGPLAAPCAGAAAYRRSAYEQVDGFDPALFAYSEDLDLGLRLLAAGWRFAEAPDARGVHLGGASSGKGSPMQRRLSSFGRGFILGRWRPAGARGLLQAVIVELAIVAWGAARHRTLVPVAERVRGLRAARAGGRRSLPSGAVDEAVGLRAALSRQARGQ